MRNLKIKSDKVSINIPSIRPMTNLNVMTTQTWARAANGVKIVRQAARAF